MNQTDNEVKIKDHIISFKQQMINMVLNEVNENDPITVDTDEENNGVDIGLLKLINNLTNDGIIAYALDSISFQEDFLEYMITDLKKMNSDEIPF